MRRLLHRLATKAYVNMSTHLVRRGGIWWTRLVVPARLRVAAGRREFIQSCRTHELVIAKMVAAVLLADWRKQLLQLDSHQWNRFPALAPSRRPGSSCGRSGRHTGQSWPTAPPGRPTRPWLRQGFIKYLRLIILYLWQNLSIERQGDKNEYPVSSTD